MKNEIVKIESTQLEKVVTESGLAIQEGEEIKKSYLPFLAQLAEIQSQATKINFDSPTEIDETIARELRLKTVKVRTGSKELKDERKKGYLLRGNLEQAAYNLIEASCKITEDVFNNVEKAREIAEKKRKEQLRIDRSEKLSPYTESVVMYPLGEMSEEQFSELYAGLRMTHEMRLEAEKKAEEKRLAEIEAERIRQENVRFENERLKKEAEAREKQLAEERIKAENERRFIEEKARKEREESERKLKAEREAARFAAEKAAAEKAKLEAAIKAKAEAEESARKEAEAKLVAEHKAKLAAEKKAKLTPDRDKLLAFMQTINNLPRPEVKSIEAACIASNANALLIKVANYILENANKL